MDKQTLDSARLRQLAEKRSLSQSELARRSGLKQPHVNLLFNGKVEQPSLATLQALAATLGVKINTLLTRKRRGNK